MRSTDTARSIEGLVRTLDDLERALGKADRPCTAGKNNEPARLLRNAQADLAESQLALVAEQVARKQADDASHYYRSLFESAPGCYIALTPDDFVVAAASDAYLQAANCTREQLMGRCLFASFPDNPDDPSADTERNLRASFERVKATGRPDGMAVQRHPLPDRNSTGGALVERFWSSVNTPVLSLEGELTYIIHRVVDVTDYVLRERESGRAVSALTQASRQEQLEADIVLRGLELGHANEHIDQSQAILRIAGRAAKLGGWRVSVPGQVVTWSDETASIHDEPAGFSPSIERALQYYAPSSRATMVQAVGDCILHGVPFDLESSLITATGREVLVRSIGEAVRNAAGQVSRVQGAFQDISTQRRAEASLRVSEERLLLLARATHDAIWDWDLATGTVFRNEGFGSLFGYRADAIEPSIAWWSGRIHSSDRAAMLAIINRCSTDGSKSWSSEYRFERHDGSFAYVLERGHIMRSCSGAAIRMIGGMTDLTEQKRAEEKLRDQTTLLDAASDAIVVRDLRHRIQYWNTGAERLYGWTSAAALGHDVSVLIYRDPTAYLEAASTTCASGEWVGELEQTARAGHSVHVLGRWTLLRDDAGEPRALLSIDTDITERKQLERRLLHAQRMESIGTLAGGIAHELNNVLAPVLMSISLLSDGESDPGRLLDLSTIETCAKRGANMVQQLLSYARGHGGQRTSVDLEAVAKEVQLLLPASSEAHITFRLFVCEAPWEIAADLSQMQQLLTNLCLNACEAMPNGGVLSVGIGQVVLDHIDARLESEAKPGPYVLLSVEDTGSGMSAAILDRVFEPFFTTKEVGKGTGLGLSTAHAIARGHGGFIHAYSQPGSGTRFEVYLPAAPSAQARERASEEQATLPCGNGELVLVVDDEEHLRNVAKRALERFGYRVMLAANGAEATHLYEMHRSEIDVVLTDMNMPIMDGPATIDALKLIDPKVRIIGSSGLNTDAQVIKATSAGVKVFVPKPYTAETMLRVLRKVLTDTETHC